MPPVTSPEAKTAEQWRYDPNIRTWLEFRTPLAARGVIARYNLRQTLLAILSLVVGASVFALTWWFIRVVSGEAIRACGWDTSPLQRSAIAWACVIIIALVGFFRWRQNEGHYRFDESGLMPTAEPRSGISLAIHERANRVGAWSYMLGQLFLAGPLQILRASDRWKSRIPNSPTLESELIAFRDELRTKNRWLSISDFAGRETQIAYLARLELIDWSPRKGTLKAR